MRNVCNISIIGILLLLVTISPVVAIPAATMSTDTYFHSVKLLHPEQGRFAASPDSFKPVKIVSTNNRFISYTGSTVTPTHTYTEIDHGMSVAITRGQVIKVQLNENPTTGYRWEPSVSSGIQVIDDTYAASSSGRMGAGGTHTWTLRITGTGNQHFSADYKRSWETGSVDTYRLQFVVT